VAFFQVFEKSRQILKKSGKLFEKSQPASWPVFFKIFPIVPTLTAWSAQRGLQAGHPIKPFQGWPAHSA
jgi:hypothetical protein